MKQIGWALVGPKGLPLKTGALGRGVAKLYSCSSSAKKAKTQRDGGDHHMGLRVVPVYIKDTE